MTKKICPTCGAEMTQTIRNVRLTPNNKPITVKNIRCFACECGETVYPASEAQKIVTVIEANSL